MRVVTTAIIAAAFFSQSCNIINPAEQVPTYIKVDSFKITSDDLNKTGSTSSKIAGVWVYVNNSLVGAYDIPGTIPVLADKNANIIMTPGISYSGLKSYLTRYPFYTADTFTLNATPGSTITRTATGHYTEAAQFQWKEDFETGNSLLKLNDNSTTDTSIVRTSDPAKVYEGGGSGYVYLTQGRPSSESINNRDIKVTAGEAYIEISYKCNTSFEIGLQTTISGQIYYEYLAGVKASAEWNKIYIGIQPFTGKYNATNVRILLKTKLPEGAGDAYVLLDNLKLISY